MTAEEKIDRFVEASRSLRLLAARQIGANDAEDVIQDALVACIEAVDRVQNPECFLGTVVRRQISALIKFRQRERQYLRTFDERRGGKCPAVLDKLIRADMMHLGLEVVNGRDREVLTRAYVLEQSRQEIGRAMQLSDTQLRLLKNRAKRRFTDAVREIETRAA